MWHLSFVKKNTIGMKWRQNLLVHDETYGMGRSIHWANPANIDWGKPQRSFQTKSSPFRIIQDYSSSHCWFYLDSENSFSPAAKLWIYWQARILICFPRISKHGILSLYCIKFIQYKLTLDIWKLLNRHHCFCLS